MQILQAEYCFYFYWFMSSFFQKLRVFKLSLSSQTFVVTPTSASSEFSSSSLSVNLQNWSKQIYSTFFFMCSLPSYCAVLSFMLFISEHVGHLPHNLSFVWALRSNNASFIGIPCGLLATSLVFFCFILAFVLILQSANTLQYLFWKIPALNILSAIFSWIPGQDSEEGRDTEVLIKRPRHGNSGVISSLHKTETKIRRWYLLHHFLQCSHGRYLLLSIPTDWPGCAF